MTGHHLAILKSLYYKNMPCWICRTNSWTVWLGIMMGLSLYVHNIYIYMCSYSPIINSNNQTWQLELPALNGWFSGPSNAWLQESIHQYIYNSLIFILHYIPLNSIIFHYMIIIYDYIWLHMLLCNSIWFYMILPDYIWLYVTINHYIYIYIYIIIYHYIYIYIIIYHYIWLIYDYTYICIYIMIYDYIWLMLYTD